MTTKSRLEGGRELARGEEANPQTNSYPRRIDHKIAQPGVPSGNEELRQLNRSRESEQRDELKQTALRIANSQRQSRSEKD